MNRPVPAVCIKLYTAAGVLVVGSLLIMLVTDLRVGWLALFLFAATLIGALLGGVGALLQDRAEMDDYGRNQPEPDPTRRYVFTGRR